MFNFGSFPTVTNCTFSGNSANGEFGIGGGMSPIIQSLISDAVAPEEKSKAYGRLSIAYTLGYAIGMLIASLPVIVK